MTERLAFRVDGAAEGSRARAASIWLPRGEVRTPVFMPVGTHATVRGQRVETLAEIGYPILLGNTYHLLLRPGPEAFRKLGGIHRFMGWDRAVLTDSGGFQIFSLSSDREITEEGATFKSYVDHGRVLLTPERSIDAQLAIGSDIMMALDQCVPSTVGRDEAEAALRLTARWARRSLAARGEAPASLFGIVQGACYADLRRESAAEITSLPFDGFAIGGLAVGEGKAAREEMTALTAELLPTDRPRYLMGVGTPLDILEAVHRGVDMFDCILPTALAAKSVAFTSVGKLSLRRGAYRLADLPLDPKCACRVCAKHSRAYLHHLFRVGEPLGSQLVAEHNLAFYHALVTSLREAILSGTFLALYRDLRERLDAEDPEAPVTPPKRTRRRGPPSRVGEYELHEGRTGAFSVRHVPSGEVMHSVNEPMAEARSLYVAQSRLAERLAAGPVVLWDVGLGAGVNAMAAILAAEELGSPHELQVVSFERDTSALRLALKHPHRFPHVKHPGPATLLREGEWRSRIARVAWRLLEGDFLTTVAAAPAPDLVYYDPFSTKTDHGLWTEAAFRRVAEACGTRATWLYTYSRSTSVRQAMHAAGLRVARGIASGPKEETTVAVTPAALAAEPALALITRGMRPLSN